MKFNSVKTVNEFFRSATKADVDSVLEKILLSERQSKIFQMYYIQKKDVGFIADSLFVSSAVIYREIKCIRNKIFWVLICRKTGKK